MSSDLGGTSKEAMMAGSWIGMRFPTPETIPYLVLFSDHTLPTIEGVMGVGYGSKRVKSAQAT